MPVITNEKNQTGIGGGPIGKKMPHGGDEVKIRYYKPDGGTFDRIYRDPNQVTRWR